jgi:hypothetical protein
MFVCGRLWVLVQRCVSVYTVVSICHFDCDLVLDATGTVSRERGRQLAVALENNTDLIVVGSLYFQAILCKARYQQFVTASVKPNEGPRLKTEETAADARLLRPWRDGNLSDNCALASKNRIGLGVKFASLKVVEIFPGIIESL